VSSFLTAHQHIIGYSVPQMVDSLGWGLPPYQVVGWLEFNVPFQHKYGYIRDDHTTWYPDASSRLATTDAPKIGGCPRFWRGWAGSPSNTMWPGQRTTRMPSFILIHQQFGHNTPTSQTGETMVW